MGCERRVVYDFVNVINGKPTSTRPTHQGQALRKSVHPARLPDLDKDALTRDGVEKILDQLAEMKFDYIVCDSPPASSLAP